MKSDGAYNESKAKFITLSNEQFYLAGCNEMQVSSITHSLPSGSEVFHQRFFVGPTKAIVTMDVVLVPVPIQHSAQTEK